jgi:pectinesterase inhibitor-like protein
MDMARSLAHLFVFLLLAASIAAAARDLPDAADNLAEACGETEFPDLCVRSLSAFHPESRAASPRRLAELSVLAALDAGRDAAAFAHDALSDDGLLFRCLDGCAADVEEAVARLSALSREPTDANFLELEAWLAAALDGDAPATYEAAACRDAPVAGSVRDAAVAKSVAFDMMLRVARDLITEACLSMPHTVARAPAYGAPYGSPSPAFGGGYGARMPLAPAPLPSRGYGHRRPRAPPHHRRPRAPVPSPAFGGGYGPRMPLAPAPLPSRGYGHRRPRVPPHHRRPRGAPAPAPFGGYGSARRPRAPAPSPFVAYGARRPGAPAPSLGTSRPPAPSTYYSIIDIDETE